MNKNGNDNKYEGADYAILRFHKQVRLEKKTYATCAQRKYLETLEEIRLLAHIHQVVLIAWSFGGKLAG